ncbi:hypothetical protein HK098_002004 [Nowakowskiella sp. JEL0407]|nr:hypothetical protein HK098_002004 [Nowakowskiella sp. JEL0407]
MKITDFFSSTTNFKENELDPSETTPTPAQKSETVISNPSITTPIKEPEFAGLPLKPPRPTVTYKRKKLPLSPPPSSPHQEETISNSVDPIPNLDLDEANAPILVENLSTNNTKDSSPQNKKQKLNSSRNLQQLTLELGQKSGLRKCRECGMEYSSKDEDYLPHFRYHASIIDGIVYKGYKNEKVVYENASSNAKIILIPNNASPSQLKKLSEILETVQVALGAVPLDIKNKWV